MANKYAGTQTEKNLEVAFAGESQANPRQEISILTLHPRQKKKALSRSLRCF